MQDYGYDPFCRGNSKRALDGIIEHAAHQARKSDGSIDTGKLIGGMCGVWVTENGKVSRKGGKHDEPKINKSTAGR